MKRHIGFIQSFAKGGNISSIDKRVAEVNAMIKEANEKNIQVVDTSVTWQAPMKYEPLVYKNGILYIKYEELDLYRNNRGQGRFWEKKSDKIGKHNTDYGVGEKEGYAQKKALTDIARMYRTALNHYNKYGYYAEGGELSEEDEREVINDMHKQQLEEYLKDPDGSGFGVFGYTDRIHKIMIGEDNEFTPEQLNDYMRDPDGMGFGLFGYTNDIKAIYNDEGFAKGGKVKKPIIRQYFEDEAFEYKAGGELESIQKQIDKEEKELEKWDKEGSFNQSQVDFIWARLEKLQEKKDKLLSKRQFAHGGTMHNDSPAFSKAFKYANPLPENTPSFAEGGKLKPRYLTTDETIAVGKKYAEALSKFDGKKYTLNFSTLEEDSFDIDSEEQEFDGGSYNVYENGNVKNMALSHSPVYGKIDSSIDEILANLKKLGDKDYMGKGGTADSRFNSIFTNYLAAALWSSNDEDGDPLDENYSIYDFSDETLKKMREDVKKFITENEEAIKASGMSDEQLGHDLWLTRNHHGAGFWDRGYDEEIGKKLTDAAQELGGTDLYIGDDGEIYAMGSYSDGGWMETTDVNARVKKDYEDEIGSLKRQIDYCNVRMGQTSEAWIQKEYRATINGCRERIEEIEKTLANIAKMAAGGTFEEGVKAIEKKLTGSKVAAKYQSLYGKKYDKKEAHVAATNIKGKMRALELAKKHKKK